jgi:small subunit ribosomal protein S16
MAVKIRMTRMGRRHRPYFRINAIESRAPRDGRILEKLGHYDPLEKDADKQIVIERERIEFWLGKGAVPSETVAQILQRHGIETKHADKKNARRAKAKAIARSKGKLFDSTERIVAEKQAKAEAEAKEAEEKAKAEAAKAAEEKAKAEAEAKEKAEAEAKAKAEAEAAKAAEAEAPAEESAPAEDEAKEEGGE